DPFPPRSQLLHHVAADVAGAAGDEDGVVLHRVESPELCESSLQVGLVIPFVELAAILFLAPVAPLGFVADLFPAIRRLAPWRRVALFLQSDIAAGAARVGAFGQGQGGGVLEAEAPRDAAPGGLAGSTRFARLDAYPPVAPVQVEALQ